jgi:hypothetical protein
VSSFRNRIQQSSLALIALLLVTLDIAVYSGFLGILHQYVDSRLQAMAESWADIAGRNLGMLLEASQKGQDAEVRSAVPNEGEQIELREAALSIQILSSDGTVFWRGAAVATPPSVDPAHLRKVIRGDKVFETVRDPAGVSSGAFRDLGVGSGGRLCKGSGPQRSNVSISVDKHARGRGLRCALAVLPLASADVKLNRRA